MKFMILVDLYETVILSRIFCNVLRFDELIDCFDFKVGVKHGHTSSFCESYYLENFRLERLFSTYKFGMVLHYLKFEYDFKYFLLQHFSVVKLVQKFRLYRRHFEIFSICSTTQSTLSFAR